MALKITSKDTLHTRLEIVCHKDLLAFEISSVSVVDWFTDKDTSSERKHLLNERRRVLSEDNTYEIAKVLNSDSHKLSALGKNAAGNKRVTRIKMDGLTFDAFKLAFIDSSARIRIEDLIPTSIPHFVGTKFEGGFLDGQTLRYSKNLTCVIGGRGAGKSTILESTRVASGNRPRGDIVDNEVWPDRITLIYEDETGRQLLFIKDKTKDLVNETDTEDGITQVAIESFGQGETAETLRHSDKNPGVMIEFFDEFISFEDFKSRDSELCEMLLENQTQIERLNPEVQTTS